LPGAEEVSQRGCPFFLVTGQARVPNQQGTVTLSIVLLAGTLQLKGLLFGIQLLSLKRCQRRQNDGFDGATGVEYFLLAVSAVSNPPVRAQFAALGIHTGVDFRYRA
jgi:hypothetical protein